MKRIFTLASVLSILLLPACSTVQSNIQTIQGSGNVVTTERNIGDFTSIQVDMGADVVLTQGDSETLTIEAEDNLMPYIETNIRNGRLIVSIPHNVSLTLIQSIRLHITFDTLQEIEIFGSSQITGENLNLDTLTIAFSGSGSTWLTGEVDEQTINIRGQATMNNFDLAGRNVTVDISGNGIINVNATDTLNVTIAGQGDIHYIGSPTITENISGQANIVQQR
jgi:hypothetical protein